MSSLSHINNYALRGIKHMNPIRLWPPWLPITPELLRKIFLAWSAERDALGSILHFYAFRRVYMSLH